MKVGPFRSQPLKGNRYIWFQPTVLWLNSVFSSSSCKICLCVRRYLLCVRPYESHLKLFISLHKPNEKCLRLVYYIPVALWDIALPASILKWPKYYARTAETACRWGQINSDLNELLWNSWKGNSGLGNLKSKKRCGEKGVRLRTPMGGGGEFQL